MSDSQLVDDHRQRVDRQQHQQQQQHQQIATATTPTTEINRSKKFLFKSTLTQPSCSSSSSSLLAAAVAATTDNNNINKLSVPIRISKPRPTPPRNFKVDAKKKSADNFKRKFLDYEEPKKRTKHDSSSSSSLGRRTRLATLTQIGEDWLYLALLGTIMAVLSFSMDSVITLFLQTRLRLFKDVSEDNILIQYLGWTVTPIVLVSFSTGFVHLCSPTAIGSGIPEMKTILRGVVLNEYLTFRTLIAKIVGLTFTLGSGLPLGKEGPFVHMASIVATLLSKLVASFQGIYENESRTSEMLSAACAVGVAATFYAPIGGVLFSIEVTTVYFAVRNYWRGFFAACCGATIWRLLSFWIKNDESITALFKTNFRTEYPFDPVELLIFSFIGASCGLGGAAYIKFHRQIVQFFRRYRRLSEYFQKHRFVYPIVVTFIITTVSFPPLLGKYTASTLNTHSTIEDLFSNRTWSLGNQDLTSKKILDQWTTDHTSFHVHLILYVLMLFWTSAVASTIPIPSGIFIPVLKMGAAYGRLVGEIMHSCFPDGISWGEYVHSSAIVPGSYAVVGAAAFSGAVTHTISTSVILFEMTGQIVHIIPVILAVLIANAVCQSLQPSIYDSIIEMKKLPYLPAIASSNSVSHKILVKDFMNTKLAFVAKEKFNYANLKNLLVDNKKITSFPLVDSQDSMKLLGSVARFDLLKLLYTHLGRERRLQEIHRRSSDIQLPNSAAFANREDPDHPSNQKRSKNKSPPPPPRRDFNNNNQLNNVATSDSGSSSEPPSPTGASFSSLENNSFNIQIRDNVNTSSSPSSSNSPASTATTSGLILKDIEDPLLGGSRDKKELVEAVAKIVNHYNRGSLMESISDSEDVEKSKAQLRFLSEGPDSSQQMKSEPSSTYDVNQVMEVGDNELRQEIAKTDDNNKKKDSKTSNNGDGNRHSKYIEKSNSNSNLFRRLSGTSFGLSLSSNFMKKSLSIKSSPLKPLVELNASSCFNVVVSSYNSTSSNDNPLQIQTNNTTGSQVESKSNNNNINNNNSITAKISRPKSILKTSSTSENLNDVYKRNISIQSLNLPNNNNNSNNNEISASEPSSHKSTSLNSSALKKKLISSGPAGTINDPQITKFTLDAIGNDDIKQSTIDPGGAGVGVDLNSLTPVRQRRRVRLPRLRVIDMTQEEQEQWEAEQLNALIDVTKCQIDGAPFQLVQQTSLYRVHTLFSMLGLNHAYVTSYGRLVGIVALKDIRYAIEEMLQEK